MPVATLPDELVLMIIEACDRLEKDPDKTLAALCRLSKRYKYHAERLLYSRIALRANAYAPIVPGTAVHTLARKTTLRPFVKSLDLDISARHAQDPQLVTVLGDLPNVEEVTLPGSSTPGLEQLLARDNVRIRSLKADGVISHLGKLLQDHSVAFSALIRLDLYNIPILVPNLLCGTTITCLSLEILGTPAAFTTFTSPFAASLTTLRLPLKASMKGHSLAGFLSLQHLSLVGDDVDTEQLTEAIPHVQSLLGTTASLDSFVSFTIEGSLFVDRYSVQDGLHCALVTPQDVLSLSKDLLAAIPSQVQHLSLVTSIVLADDVATFLLGPSRPPALRTLRLGGGVGQGFKESARSRSAWYSNFERTMEEAGVEVTTVE